MFRKKLIAVMAAGIIGTTMYGGSGNAFAHEGHDHDGATGFVATAEAANKGGVCPVSGDKVDAKAKFTYTYKGKVYRLCCASCLADFKKDPEKYIGKMNGEAAGEEPRHPEGHDHHDHD